MFEMTNHCVEFAFVVVQVLELFGARFLASRPFGRATANGTFPIACEDFDCTKEQEDASIAPRPPNGMLFLSLLGI